LLLRASTGARDGSRRKASMTSDVAIPSMP
jgi:hypothetical protein